MYTNYVWHGNSEIEHISVSSQIEINISKWKKFNLSIQSIKNLYIYIIIFLYFQKFN